MNSAVESEPFNSFPWFVSQLTYCLKNCIVFCAYAYFGIPNAVSFVQLSPSQQVKSVRNHGTSASSFPQPFQLWTEFSLTRGSHTLLLKIRKWKHEKHLHFADVFITATEVCFFNPEIVESFITAIAISCPTQKNSSMKLRRIFIEIQRNQRFNEFQNVEIKFYVAHRNLELNLET